MHIDELRRRVGDILAVEESEPPDWKQVAQLTDELLRQLVSEPDTECPEIVNHYLDDMDIRDGDEVYAGRQRQRVRLFVETGKYEDSKPVPLWTCAVALAIIIAFVVWLSW